MYLSSKWLPLRRYNCDGVFTVRESSPTSLLYTPLPTLGQGVVCVQYFNLCSRRFIWPVRFRIFRFFLWSLFTSSICTQRFPLKRGIFINLKKREKKNPPTLNIKTIIQKFINNNQMKMSKKNGLKIFSETPTNKLGRKYELSVHYIL